MIDEVDLGNAVSALHQWMASQDLDGPSAFEVASAYATTLLSTMARPPDDLNAHVCDLVQHFVAKGIPRRMESLSAWRSHRSRLPSTP
jgi:hypothetical protein